MLEKTLESLLDCKEIKPVNSKGNQSWIFIGRTDAEAEAPIIWPPDVENWLIGKDPDSGKDWRQEEKGMTEDEMVGWHHQLDGHEFGQALGVGDGQGSLACCSPWGRKELDTTEWLNWTDSCVCNWHLANPLADSKPLERRRQWHPTPVLLPGKSHGWRSLVGCSPWGHYESDTTERLHFHTLEKEMATHSSVLAWRIPGTGKPGGLPCMVSHRVGHDWSDLAAAASLWKEEKTGIIMFSITIY